MRSFEEHREIVADLIGSRPAASLPLAAAAGLVLAEEVRAPADLPPFDNSAMDGYAVLTADVAAASSTAPALLEVTADIPAGTVSRAPVRPGTAQRIMTGAPLPPGADGIVPVEDTDRGLTTVAIQAPAEPGRFIRRAGSDIAAGDLALQAGQRLGAAQLGLLAAFGRTSVSVRPPLRVLIVTTGDELADPREGLRHEGQIFESNGLMLSTAVTEAGAVAAGTLVLDDAVDRFVPALEAALGDVDLILTSGGVSAGSFEVVKEALAPRGVSFDRVAVQPGMPQGAGRFEGVPVVCLPGNPVSSYVSFEGFVRPALRSAMGLQPARRPVETAVAVEDFGSIAGKRQLRRARWDRESGTVALCGPPSSHHLRWLAAADAFIDIPAEVTEIVAGTAVSVWDLTR